jgi:predicted component of type VI protein secretion system
MTPTLVFEAGPLAGRRNELESELVVGREDASLTIDDPEISRKHAAIRPAGDGFEIEDLGSRNGTHVNGSRIEGTTRLGGGDSIKLGQSVIRFESGRAAATVASPVPSAPTTPSAPVAPTAHAPSPPAPSAPAPAAPAPIPAAPSAAPKEPFGAYATPVSGRRRRGVASRQVGPQILTFLAIIATAVAIAIYFAQH